MSFEQSDASNVTVEVIVAFSLPHTVAPLPKLMFIEAADASVAVAIIPPTRVVTK